MKFLIVFLTIYIIYLIALPCVDAISPFDGNISVHNSGHDQDSNDHHDACSPFCVCSCCSIVVVVSDAQLVSKPFVNIISIIIPPNQDFISNFFNSVWRPPKVA